MHTIADQNKKSEANKAKNCSPLKTLREEEKLLLRSNFSFSHSVFYLFQILSAIFIKLFQFGRVQNLLFGKQLNLQLLSLIIVAFVASFD